MGRLRHPMVLMVLVILTTMVLVNQSQKFDNHWWWLSKFWLFASLHLTTVGRLGHPMVLVMAKFSLQLQPICHTHYTQVHTWWCWLWGWWWCWHVSIKVFPGMSLIGAGLFSFVSYLHAFDSYTYLGFAFYLTLLSIFVLSLYFTFLSNRRRWVVRSAVWSLQSVSPFS